MVPRAPLAAHRSRRRRAQAWRSRAPTTRRCTARAPTIRSRSRRSTPSNYTQLEGDIQGLTKQQIDDKHKPLDQSPASGSFDPAGAGSGSGSSPPSRITPDPTLPTVTQDPKKATPRLEVTTADASAYRGDVVHVEGRVSASGRALGDHPVDVFLAPAGQNGAHPIPLGRTVTDAAGHFTQDFTLPGTLDLKTYEIFLASPEDVTYNAALSN